MKNLLAALLAIAFVLLAPTASARSTRMIEPQTIDLDGADGQPLRLEDTRAAILAGANTGSVRWHVVEEGEGRIQLSTTVRRKHTLVVAAMYSAGAVRFDYVSSVEMNHDVRRDGAVYIHPNYMVWRTRLEDAVRADAARR